jgi:glycosyltransferase involved in cell wall biosynthesis
MHGLRVLLQCRPDVLRFGGGESQQIFRLTEELLRRGVEVDVSSDCTPTLNGYDLVHVFNLTQPAETLAQTVHAKRHGKRVILSPVYQDFREYDKRGRHGLARLVYGMVRDRRRAETLKEWVRTIRRPESWPACRCALGLGIEEQRKRVLELVDGFVTNSHLEMEAIRRDYGAAGTYRVSTYAVHPMFFGARPDAFRNGTGINGSIVVCAGFISSLKNQLTLIEALRDTGLTLVLVGSKVTTHRHYYGLVRRAVNRGNPHVVMLGTLSQEDLASVYAAATVVVLPSWFETCGMACLEGAAAGANVVVTNRGYPREYFRDFAWYCDPADASSIREAIMGAHQAPRPSEFGRYIRAHYTWEKAADEALHLYHEVLQSK